MNASPREILLVEDNANDEELICRALRSNPNVGELTVARDGAEALDYLFGRAGFAGRDVRHQPAVVLLDLNLPKLSGLQVLGAIRADPRTSLLPVVIMTSSRQELDLRSCYASGASSFVVKPVPFAEFTERVALVGRYWLELNEPSPCAGRS